MLLDGVPDAAPGPAARSDAKESIELAFVTALQHMPPRQRAVLVLRDVLGYPAAEAAGMLGTTEASVKGALQRARAALQAQLPVARDFAPLPGSPRERQLAGRFATAVEAGDIDAVLTLLTSDAWLTMPPEPYEYQGPRPSPPSCATGPPCAAPRCGWCPPGPTPSPPSAATCPAPRPRSPGPTG